LIAITCYLPTVFFKYYEYNRINTKSVVAVVKKPKAVPKAAKAVLKTAPKVVKATVKKPKAVPKAVPKVAKAVVKKPKAAKAVPKAAKAVVKKPKATKAVVKKPIRGGTGSKAESRIAASIRGIFPASARRIGNTFTRLQRKTPSNAVAPSNVSLTAIEKGVPQGRTPSNAVLAPIVIEKEVRLTKLKSMLRPPPNFLLDKIKDTYELYMEKLLNNEFTVYDLLVLIDTIATDLNAFFEDFLYYYPTIIFKDNKYASNIYSRGLLTYQSKFVRLIENIRHYIHELKTEGGQDIGIPYDYKYRRRNVYLDASTIVYNGILDGTQSKEMYENRQLNFFTNELILSTDTDGRYSSYIRKYERIKIHFGRLLVFVGENLIEFNTIIMELNVILQEFFMHIQFIGINEGVGARDKNKIVQSGKYIELVKETAKENLRIISSYPYKFKILIQAQKQESKEDIERRSANAKFFAENQQSPI